MRWHGSLTRRPSPLAGGVESDDRPDVQLAGRDRDTGSVLPLVLVMMIIGSLIVIPMMRYATTVLSANTVLSKTTRLESAKAGLRLSLADPVGV